MCIFCVASLCLRAYTSMYLTWPTFVSHRGAVRRWCWEEHVQQPAQVDSVPGRLPGLPGIRGLERKAPWPAGRCPSQGGRGGARLWRWGREHTGKYQTSVSHSCNRISERQSRGELRGKLITPHLLWYLTALLNAPLWLASEHILWFYYFWLYTLTCNNITVPSRSPAAFVELQTNKEALGKAQSFAKT